MKLKQNDQVIKEIEASFQESNTQAETLLKMFQEVERTGNFLHLCCFDDIDFQFNSILVNSAQKKQTLIDEQILKANGLKKWLILNLHSILQSETISSLESLFKTEKSSREAQKEELNSLKSELEQTKMDLEKSIEENILVCFPFDFHFLSSFCKVGEEIKNQRFITCWKRDWNGKARRSNIIIAWCCMQDIRADGSTRRTTFRNIGTSCKSTRKSFISMLWIVVLLFCASIKWFLCWILLEISRSQQKRKISERNFLLESEMCSLKNEISNQHQQRSDLEQQISEQKKEIEVWFVFIFLA